MPGARARILIVDDDTDVLEALELMLEDAFDVTIASSGAEALRHASTASFEAIVLDLMMPGIDGGAVVQELRNRGIATPIILLSALSDLGDKARQLGVFAAESKPVDIARLQRTIEKAIAAGGSTGGSQTPRGGSAAAPTGDPPSSALHHLAQLRWAGHVPAVN